MSRTLAKERTTRQWSSSPEWYTPPWLLERITAFYGGPYFDPCPARNGKPMRDNPHASVLVYRGPRVDAFADAFADLGPILRTYRAYDSGAPQLWEVSA